MPNSDRLSLLARAAQAAPSGGSVRSGSILTLAATSFGARPTADVTIPTGFDPAAAALFESIVEGAYLVASADGLVDDEERRAFEGVVVAACGGAVAPRHIAGLVDELHDRLRREGADRCIERLASNLSRKEQAQEVLRIAALVALASEGVSDVERRVLGQIAARCGLDAAQADAAIVDARRSLTALEHAG